MNRASGWTLLASGGLALLCAPAILVAEQLGWSQRPLHGTQLLATMVCLVSSARFLWAGRGEVRGWPRVLAIVALGLSGLWLCFVCFVLLSLDLAAIG
ncbi:MAG: hypothetical protein ACYTG2_17725 [Planctomycetota bacterium]|jgi:hypothetical protein